MVDGALVAGASGRSEWVALARHASWEMTAPRIPPPRVAARRVSGYDWVISGEGDLEPPTLMGQER